MRKPALMLRPPCSGRRIVGVRLRAEDRAVVGLGALEQLLAQRRAVLLQARKAGVVEVEREIEAETAVGGAQHASAASVISGPMPSAARTRSFMAIS